VKTAVRDLVVKKGVYHGDMKREHVLLETAPTKKGKKATIVRFVDLAKARKAQEGENVDTLVDVMLSKLNLDKK